MFLSKRQKLLLAGGGIFCILILAIVLGSFYIFLLALGGGPPPVFLGIKTDVVSESYPNVELHLTRFYGNTTIQTAPSDANYTFYMSKGIYGAPDLNLSSFSLFTTQKLSNDSLLILCEEQNLGAVENIRIPPDSDMQILIAPGCNFTLIVDSHAKPLSLDLQNLYIHQIHLEWVHSTSISFSEVRFNDLIPHVLHVYSHPYSTIIFEFQPKIFIPNRNQTVTFDILCACSTFYFVTHYPPQIGLNVSASTSGVVSFPTGVNPFVSENYSQSLLCYNLTITSEWYANITWVPS
jgi:hypothetical protein